uniref:Nuclease associated modular domain-containing protein n=1 Tax=Oryza punctata TaxID=4537 RepID=A0A0E0M695_ORYPU
MAPQLQGCYAVSSWPRLPQQPPWPCASHAQRLRVLRLLPARRRCAGAVRVVAEAGPALAIDRVAEEADVRFPGDVEEVPGHQQQREEEKEDAVDERERLRRMRISKANKGNTPWNKGRKHTPETLQRIRERTRIAMQDPKVKSYQGHVVKKKLMHLGHAQR